MDLSARPGEAGRGLGSPFLSTISANQTTLYTQVMANQLGTPARLLRTFGYLGSIASSAIISIAFHISVTDHGLHVIAMIMVIVIALGLVIVLADRKIMSQVGPTQPDPHRTRHRPRCW